MTPGESFIELYAGVVSIAAIGRSLLGEAEYRNLLQRLEPGQQAILLAGDGRYSFKGSGYVRGGIFDRFQIMQGDASIRFHDYQHKRLRQIAAEGAPDLNDVDLFLVPPDQAFDPALPWKLELLVGRATGATEKAFLTFDLAYSPPEKYLTYIAPEKPASEGLLSWLGADAPDAPLWKKMWVAKLPEIAVLLVALGVLTVIFFFQDWLVKRPLLTDRVRIGFLLFTLFGTRLVHECAAVSGQYPCGLQCPGQRFRLELFPHGTADFHSLGCGGAWHCCSGAAGRIVAGCVPSARCRSCSIVARSW